MVEAPRTCPRNPALAAHCVSRKAYRQASDQEQASMNRRCRAARFPWLTLAWKMAFPRPPHALDGGWADAAGAPTPATTIAPTAAIAATRFFMGSPSSQLRMGNHARIGLRPNRSGRSTRVRYARRVGFGRPRRVRAKWAELGSSQRPPACQAEGRGFESHQPLSAFSLLIATFHEKRRLEAPPLVAH